ncbi:MAG: rhodanese-like domain-containing protein [Verrucomicrobiaceae bacterium]
MNPELSGDLTMSALLDQYPGARRALFASFHIGGCQSCAYELDDTLAAVCAQNELDLNEALACLKESQAHDAEMLISVADLEAHLKSDSPPLVLDVRTREEFDSIHLPGSEFMTQERQSEVFSSSDESTLIILIDHQGRTVLDQCAWFRGHGLKNTYGVDGGIDRYAREIDSSIPRYRLELE